MLTPSSTSTSPANSTRSAGSQTSRSPAECPAPGWLTTIVLPPSLSVSERRDRTVGLVGELEAPHGVETDHPHPVGDQRVFPAIGGERPPVGMRDHPRAGLPQDDGAEVMVGMMVGEHQPLDRTVGDPADGAQQLLALPRTRQRIDHDHAFGRHHEPGVGPSLDAASGIAHDGIDARRERSKRKRPCGVGGGEREEDERQRERSQAEANLMSADCLKTPPLLSVQTMVRGASRSARRVKLTMGSRLMPEVQVNRAISCPRR